MGKIKIKFQEQKEFAPINLDKYDDDTYRMRESRAPSTTLMNHLVFSLVPSEVIAKVFGSDESQ
jgi:hypothetical protein